MSGLVVQGSIGRRGTKKEFAVVPVFVLVTSLLAFGSASAFQVSSIATGADMAGIQAAASFETATWITTLTDGSMPNGEGLGGAATGTNWSLTQQGFTDGGLDNGSVLGAWTLVNDTNIGMVSLVTAALTGRVAVDIVGVQDGDTAGYTPGSSASAWPTWRQWSPSCRCGA